MVFAFFTTVSPIRSHDVRLLGYTLFGKFKRGDWPAKRRATIQTLDANRQPLAGGTNERSRLPCATVSKDTAQPTFTPSRKNFGAKNFETSHSDMVRRRTFPMPDSPAIYLLFCLSIFEASHWLRKVAKIKPARHQRHCIAAHGRLRAHESL